MIRRALVLRPAPADALTAARLAAAGVEAIRLPLFAVVPLAWQRPPGTFDALLVTSANAVRHAGADLATVADLPVAAVGEPTAVAARAAGLDVQLVGMSDGNAIVARAQARGWHRLLRIAGRDRIQLSGVTDVPVYAAEALALAPGAMKVAEGTVALLHSPRAARRFAALADRDRIDRTSVRIAALSAAVADAAGEHWAARAIAPQMTDSALVALAARLAIDP